MTSPKAEGKRQDGVVAGLQAADRQLGGLKPSRFGGLKPAGYLAFIGVTCG
jgi:hypothetical protein